MIFAFRMTAKKLTITDRTYSKSFFVRTYIYIIYMPKSSFIPILIFPAKYQLNRGSAPTAQWTPTPSPQPTEARCPFKFKMHRLYVYNIQYRVNCNQYHWPQNVDSFVTDFAHFQTSPLVDGNGVVGFGGLEFDVVVGCI